MGEGRDSVSGSLPGDRDWKPGFFTELRVHGVGNTALDQLLDDPFPRQVAGDEVAGFYRSRSDRPLILEPTPPADPGPDDRCQDEVLRAPRPPIPEPDPNQPVEETEDWRDRLRWTDVEAYDWGGFNTGGGWKAMWLFLLPFTLANVAGWLVAGRSKRGQKWVRLLGLGTSLLFVTWLGAVVIDLVALRCGWQEACYDRQVWLKPYGWELFSTPSSRIALALVLPLAVTWVLWKWPGGRSHQKYEQQTPEAQEDLREAVATGDLSDLDKNRKTWLRNPNIWARASEVRLDASLHAAAILATLGGAVAWANWIAKGFVLDLVLAGAGFILLFVAGLIVWGWLPFAGDRREVPEGRVRQARWIGWISVVFMVVIIATSFIDRGYATVDWSDVASSPAGDEWTLQDFEGFLTGLSEVKDDMEIASAALRDALFTANGVVLFLPLFALGWMALRPPKGVDIHRNRRLWGRWGPVAALLAGLAIAASLVVGAGLWLEEWLGDRPNEHLAALGVEEMEELSATQDRLAFLIAETDDESILPLLAHTAQLAQPQEAILSQPVIELPDPYDLAALGFFALALVMLVVYGVLELRLRRSIGKNAFPVQHALCGLAGQKLTGRTPDERKRWRQVGVREMRKSPRLTRIHHLFWPPVVFMVAFGVFLPIDRLVTGVDWVVEDLAWTTAFIDWITANASWLFTAARWLITAVTVIVATLVYRSYKPEAQESFGGMWDVISFLPRHYHPYAVPSYGERAVPELQRRITQLTHSADASDGRVLVSAHSGGVVISLAAICLLDEETLERVSFLSYGSPTGALYGRAYPEYFDTQRLVEDVAERLGPGTRDVDKVRWFNLWRLTDWTGGYAFGPSRDRFEEYRCSDPVSPARSKYSAMVGHIERIQFDPACQTVRESPDFDPLALAIGHTDYLHDPKHVGPEDPRYQDARGALLWMMA